MRKMFKTSLPALLVLTLVISLPVTLMAGCGGGGHDRVSGIVTPPVVPADNDASIVRKDNQVGVFFGANRSRVAWWQPPLTLSQLLGSGNFKPTKSFHPNASWVKVTLETPAQTYGPRVVSREMGQVIFENVPNALALTLRFRMFEDEDGEVPVAGVGQESPFVMEPVIGGHEARSNISIGGSYGIQKATGLTNPVVLLNYGETDGNNGKLSDAQTVADSDYSGAPFYTEADITGAESHTGMLIIGDNPETRYTVRWIAWYAVADGAECKLVDSTGTLLAGAAYDIKSNTNGIAGTTAIVTAGTPGIYEVSVVLDPGQTIFAVTETEDDSLFMYSWQAGQGDISVGGEGG